MPETMAWYHIVTPVKRDGSIHFRAVCLFSDWAVRDDIKNQLNMDLTVLLYENGYPPEWDEEVFEKVMAQAENFKKNEG